MSLRASTKRTGGFTLVEVMVATAVVMLLAAAALTSIVVLAKGGYALGNYSAMNSESRFIIEQMGMDVRQLSSITTATSTSFSGTMLGGSGSTTQAVSYSYNATDQTLTRSLDGTAVRVFKNIDALTFGFYNAKSESTATLSHIKQIQLRGKTRMRVGGLGSTTGRILSAQFAVRSISTL